MGVGAMIGAASYHVATCPQGPSFCLNGIGGDRATLAVIGATAGLLGEAAIGALLPDHRVIYQVKSH
jgi:hypothetical protein